MQKTYATHSKWMLLATLLFTLLLANHQTVYSNPTDSLSQKIDDFLGDRSPDGPGAVLIVTQDGKELNHTLFGKANLETQTDITDETVFEAASVTKQFTAAAILLLVEQGKLSLADDVHQYIPELPEYGATITIKHLLTHTSGLNDWRNVVYLTPWRTGERLYTQDFAVDLICKQSILNFQPGAQYRYTNAGYDLLSTIVERITGQSFASFVQENLLKPAGMIHSRIRGKYTDVIKNRANGYIPAKNHYLQAQTMDETYGAAGLLTTASDLQKWNAYIYSDQVSDSFKSMRLEQFTLNDGTKIPYANGGVEVHDHNGQMEIRHGGFISGYRAWVAYYPETKTSITYMSNDQNISSSKISETVADVLFGEAPKTPEGKPSASKNQGELAGIYQNIDDVAYYLELSLQNGQLVYNKEPVLFQNGNTIVLNDNVYQFEKGKLVQHTEAGTFTYVKVDSLVLSSQQLTTYSGKFYSPDCDVTFTLLEEDGKLKAARSSYDKIVLTPLYKKGNTSTFRGLSKGLRVFFHFTKNEDGTLDLMVSLPRAAHIPFIKQ